MIQVPAPPAPPPIPDVVSVGIGSGAGPFDSPAFVFVFLAVIAAATLVLWPLARALARRLEGQAGPGEAVLNELEELRTRVRELEGTQSRLMELEERLDFTERILTQRDAARLPEAR